MLETREGLEIAGGLVVDWWLARLFWEVVATGNARVNTNGPSREHLFHLYSRRAAGQPITSVGTLKSREDGGTARNDGSIRGSPQLIAQCKALDAVQLQE
jgi:hypothetical protein